MNLALLMLAVRAIAGGGGTPAVVYGATVDQGETDDPLVDATAYSGSTTYALGQLVSTAGSAPYYYSKLSGNLGNTLATTSAWRQISNIYYFANAGSDSSSADGTNATYAKAHPFATLSKAYNTFVKSGGSAPTDSLLLFNRGDTFVGTLPIYLSCIVGAYGTRGSSRPTFLYDNSTTTYRDEDTIIRPGVANVTARNLLLNGRKASLYTFTAGTGTFVAGDLVSRTSDGLMPGIVAGIVGGAATPHIMVIHTNSYDAFASGDGLQTSGGAKTGTIASGGTNRGLSGGALVRATNFSLLNTEITSALGNGVTLGLDATANSADYAFVQNCIIHGSCTYSLGAKGSGIDGGWGTGIKVQNNSVYDNGLSSIYSHNIYLDDLDHFDVSYNDSYYTSNLGNQGFVVHGTASYGEIHHNKVHECGNGIAVVDGVYGRMEGYSYINIHNNIIANCGTLSGQTQGQPIEMADAVNCSIYDNVIYGNKAQLIIYDVRSTGFGNPTSSNVKIYQNTIDCSSHAGDGIYLYGASFLNLDIRNNIFYSSSASQQIIDKNVNFPTTQINLQNNLLYAPNNAASAIRWDSTASTTGGTLYSVAGLITAAKTGISSTVIGANSLSGNPLFVSPGTNYALQSSSPAKAAGVTGLGITSDFAGTAFGSPPNMGAYA